MKLISSRRCAIAFAATMAIATVIGSGTSAIANEDAIGVVAVNADSWEVVEDGLALVQGTRSCTVGAGQPARSANQVKGSGWVTCNKNYSLLTLEVCIEVKQSVADDSGTLWQTLSCNPKKQARTEDELRDTHTAACVPGPQYYRTFVEATGFHADDPDNPAMSATITSPRILLDCFL